MDIDKILALIDKVSASGLTEFTLEEGNLQLCMKKEQVIKLYTGENEALPKQERMAEAFVTEGEKNGSSEEGIRETTDSGKALCAPLVGTFYFAPSPEEPPFVKPGDAVKKGQTLGIIEAMKLMNEIAAEYDGIVEAVLAENGAMVEYGQPLFKIRPAGEA